MNRDRAYYRKMRAKAIRRKRRISDAVYNGGWVCPDGALSKGKIHCSCVGCSQKTNNKHRKSYYPYNPKPCDWKHSDMVKIQKMNDDENEYVVCQAEIAFVGKPNLNQTIVSEEVDYSAVVDNVSLDGIPLDGHSYDEYLFDF